MTDNIQIPASHEITGQLVDLQTPKPSDYAELKRILNDQTTMKSLASYFKTTVWTDEMIKNRYGRFLKEQAEQRVLTYAIVRRDTNQVIGNCGFKNIELKQKKAEFGIILHHSVWGSGISKECHLLCLEYVFSTLKLETIQFVTDEENSRMNGFFKKIGISLIKKTNENFLLYELFHNDWPNVRERLSS